MGNALNISSDLAIRGLIVYFAPTFLRTCAYLNRFPFSQRLLCVPSTLRNFINLYRGPVEYCSNVLRREIQQRLSLPAEERPVRSSSHLSLYLKKLIRDVVT